MKSLITFAVGIQHRMRQTLKDETGATMVEYALMVALIAAVCVVAVTGIGTTVQGQFNNITAAL